MQIKHGTLGGWKSLADLYIGICYPMQSVTVSKVSIELLDIDWHKICIRWQKGSQ